MSPNPPITPIPPAPSAVLDFWFALERPGKKHDAVVREALGGLYEQAARGELAEWAQDRAGDQSAGGLEAPRGRLALILLLDQAPRHLFRDDPRAYATDPMAAELAATYMGASSQEEDWAGLRPLEIFYAAHPWLHAEHEPRQARINPVFHRIAPQLPGLEYMAPIADLYWETIRRFGRFPHRNALLGRETTEAEARFLAGEWNQRRREARSCPLMEANPDQQRGK